MLADFARLDKNSHITVERGINPVTERLNPNICPLDGLNKSIVCVCVCSYTCMCDLYFDECVEHSYWFALISHCFCCC